MGDNTAEDFVAQASILYAIPPPKRKDPLVTTYGGITVRESISICVYTNLVVVLFKIKLLKAKWHPDSIQLK